MNLKIPTATAATVNFSAVSTRLSVYDFAHLLVFHCVPELIIISNCLFYFSLLVAMWCYKYIFVQDRLNQTSLNLDWWQILAEMQTSVPWDWSIPGLGFWTPHATGLFTPLPCWSVPGSHEEVKTCENSDQHNLFLKLTRPATMPRW